MAFPRLWNSTFSWVLLDFIKPAIEREEVATQMPHSKVYIVSKRRLGYGQLITLLVAIASVSALIFFEIIPSQPAWGYARELKQAMDSARSVSLVEFERSVFGRELVFQRVRATPSQIAALKWATEGWVAPIPERRAMCFNPHHRVEVVRADGAELRFEVCFQCNNFVLGSLSAKSLPALWRSRLAKVFAEAGMPPRRDYSELERRHPDYHLLQEEIDHLNVAPARTGEGGK